MTKRELVQALSERTDLSQFVCEKVMNAFTDQVKKSLEDGDEVRLTGLGKFVGKNRAARKVKNYLNKKDDGSATETHMRAHKAISFQPTVRLEMENGNV